MRNKALELSLYVAGAGAFGVFLRWMEDQLSFNEQGLADPGAFHVLFPLFLAACAAVFLHFVVDIDHRHYYVPEQFEKALCSELTLHRVLSIVLGAMMALGGLMLLSKSELDPFTGMLRTLSALAALSGIAYPLVLEEARKEQIRAGLLCLLMLLPVLLFAVWLLLSYRNNIINSVPLAYGPDMLAAILAMLAYFRMAGFAFGSAKPSRALFLVMLSASVCILSVADKRYLGMEVILLAAAGQLLLYLWIMLKNLKPRERRVIPRKDDGFEHL